MFVYREEIDGLRAVAVVPVILYHAGFHRFFAGGYVGVDIFFVISGYLITSVIETECDRQTFSLINFYERRCRRILPALFLILFISSPFAYYWMLPSQLVEFGQSLISILALSSNFFFWWKDSGYFSTLAELNPLVHTWSLAVEEQFYFVFPLLCYFFNQKKRQLITILIFFALLSFILAQWGGNLYSIGDQQFQMFAQHSWASFYLPVGRAWELLFGAFAAFYLRTDNSVGNCNRKCKEFFAFLGLVFITISVVLFDNRNIYPFPNCYTLLPTCGATLVILFGEKSTLVGTLLSKTPFRWVGLISYSAYLWHQPLLAFIRLRYNETLSSSSVVIFLSAVLLLSVLSYLLIEQPFRKKQIINQKRIFISSFVATALTFAFALFLIRTANNRSLLAEEGGDSYLADLKKYGNLEYTFTAYDKDHQGIRSFSNDTSSTKKRLVLIGDSYSLDFLHIVVQGKYLTNYEICPYFVHSECQIYMGPEDKWQFIGSAHRQMCTSANDIRYALPIIRQADVIVLVSLWRYWSGMRLPATIKSLNLTKEQKVLIIGAKHFGRVQPMLYVNKSKEYRTAQYGHSAPDMVQLNTWFEKNIDPTIFVNLMKMVCTGYNNTCPHFTRDGKLISYDSMHLTREGALYVGKMIFGQKPLNQL